MGPFVYSEATVIVRLGLKTGKTVCDEEVYGKKRRRIEEIAAAPASQLSKFDKAQEEGVVQQQESEKRSVSPKISQGKTGSNKEPPKN